MIRRCIFGLTAPLVLVACSGTDQSVTTESIAREPVSTPISTEPLTTYEKTLLNGPPFNILLENGELPELPSEVPGFDLYSGADRSGKSGAIKKDTIRVFAGNAYPTLIYRFPWQGNNCGDAMWILRWTTENPDVLISATNEVDNYGNVIGISENPWGTEWATSGIMSNYICLQPGFRFAGTLNGNQSNLGDVSLEWSFFDTDYFNAD